MVRRVLLLILLFQLSKSEKLTLCVSNDTETGNSFCTSTKECSNSTLSAILNISNHSDVEIYLCSEVYNVTKSLSIEFHDVEAVAVLGVALSGYSPRVECHNSSFGLLFENVTNVEVRNITLFQCGFERSVQEFNLIAALYIVQSLKICIDRITIEDSAGTGIVLANNCDDINVTNVNFTRSKQMMIPTHGLLIYSSENSSQSKYLVQDCTFFEIGKNRYNAKKDQTDLVQSGGGLTIYFSENTNTITLVIENCKFYRNQAINAGALGLLLKDSVHNVLVTVLKSHFEENDAELFGGAVVAGFLPDIHGRMTQNSVCFHSCNFTSNQAYEGGAVYFFAAPSYHGESDNRLLFADCYWVQNGANYGSAVFVAPYSSQKYFKDGNFPTPAFRHCSFIKHCSKSKIIDLTKREQDSHYNPVQHGRGAFHTNTLHIKFEGNIDFTDNSYSALYLFSSIAEITSNSYVLFYKNVGYQGGAITMIGPSSVFVNDDSTIMFENNTADLRGGAIYHGALTDRSQSTSAKCFVKYSGNTNKSVNKRNINLSFRGNTIAGKHSEEKLHLRGQSVFLFSTAPCKQLYEDGENNSFFDTLNNIASFTFEPHNLETHIGTSAARFGIQESANIPTSIIPGRETDLKLSLSDELGFKILQPVYRVLVVSEFNINSRYSIITQNKISLTGPVECSGKLILTILNQADISFHHNFTMENCPPGYVHLDNACQCSANTKFIYRGIHRCDLAKFQATLISGYWAGYTVRGNYSYMLFRTSNCPLGHCMVTKESEILLPRDPASLNDAICSKNRAGRVCGRCKRNTSVYYHTQNMFGCVENKNCHLGFLLFIVSEILPVTILFVVVILFDIQLTTGTLNGFLLYMQIFNTLHLSANNFITFPRTAKHLLTTFVLIVQMFNLKFISHPKVSFCLFKGANTLDLLLFDYVTIFYSLFLILLTILLMSPRLKMLHCFQKLRGKKYIFSRSIVHGLSGFLVMCYSRSTTLSLEILTPLWLYQGERSKSETVVFYDGEMDYFKEEHLKYAVPALFALIVVTLLPPLLLLAYPLCFRVLALLRLGESKVTKIMCSALPVERLRPFFDSIQCAFRDEHRYFAGLYFVYRLLALLLFLVSRNLFWFYFMLEIQLILMLALHSWVQPYKKKWHNRLDTFIFTLLLILNGITLYNYHLTINNFDSKRDAIDVLSTSQVILSYSPLAVMLLYLLKKLRVRKLFQLAVSKVLKKKGSNPLELTLSMLDQGRGEDDGDDLSYRKADM